MDTARGIKYNHAPTQGRNTEMWLVPGSARHPLEIIGVHVCRHWPIYPQEPLHRALSIDEGIYHPEYIRKLLRSLCQRHMNKQRAPFLVIQSLRVVQNLNQADKRVHQFCVNSRWASHKDSACPNHLQIHRKNGKISGRFSCMEDPQKQKLEGLPVPLHWGPGRPLIVPA